ncbi:major facilitator superfamily protein [Heliomicrobium modesticaldum Ice1]|uniref:Major facilitator superfamily protein n=1 Tax=Heliobacterium modesticaldum (strain ATCC 51547 / Ice1) TaxID=498761 RepID=B0TDL7_HELMI|nr:MFS transporter [Heliomicrobium modesticaldum]ABZ85542.1 major facilitator superfamily protein [Heliomicrobium modesticaldum Ice1]
MTIQQIRILVTYLSGVFLGALDQGIIGPALTTIVRDFNISPKWCVWAVTVYTLVYAVSMPITAKLADRYGRRRIFMTGMAFFAVGSLFCALSDSLYLLLVGRAVQALGGGGILPVAVAEIGLAFPQERRGRALGLYGATWGIASIVAPILGGVVIQYLSWPWLFLINVPAAALLIVLAFGLPEEVEPQVKAMDWQGALLVGMVIFCFMLGLTHIQGQKGWSGVWMPNVYLFLLAGLLLIPLLFWVERNAEDPIVNPAYFQNPRLLTIFLLAALSGMVMLTVLFMPAYVEYVLHFPPGKASYMVVPLALASVVTSPLGGLIVDRFGASRTLSLGFGATAVGAVVLAVLVEQIGSPADVSTRYIMIVTFGFILLGGGLGLIVGSPLNVLVMGEVDRREVSSGLAVMTVIRSLGNTLGPVVMGGLLATATSLGQPKDGFVDIFTALLVIASLGLLLTTRLREK